MSQERGCVMFWVCRVFGHNWYYHRDDSWICWRCKEVVKA